VSKVQKSFVIQNELGLHARAATRFVQTTGRFRADVEIERDGMVVNGKSIMGILLLVAPRGSSILVRTTGDDAEQAMRAIAELVDGRFGEE